MWFQILENRKIEPQMLDEMSLRGCFETFLKIWGFLRIPCSSCFCPEVAYNITPIGPLIEEEK